jgi:hypothetical protein
MKIIFIDDNERFFFGLKSYIEDGELNIMFVFSCKSKDLIKISVKFILIYIYFVRFIA